MPPANAFVSRLPAIASFIPSFAVTVGSRVALGGSPSFNDALEKTANGPRRQAGIVRSAFRANRSRDPAGTADFRLMLELAYSSAHCGVRQKLYEFLVNLIDAAPPITQIMLRPPPRCIGASRRREARGERLP